MIRQKIEILNIWGGGSAPPVIKSTLPKFYPSDTLQACTLSSNYMLRSGTSITALCLYVQCSATPVCLLCVKYETEHVCCDS